MSQTVASGFLTQEKGVIFLGLLKLLKRKVNERKVGRSMPTEDLTPHQKYVRAQDFLDGLKLPPPGPIYAEERKKLLCAIYTMRF